MLLKSYTDFSQSKVLAKILRIDSADMMYHSVENEYGGGAFVVTSKVMTNGLENKDFYIDDIPCWSLAALLSVIPCSYKVYRHPYDDGLSLSLQISNCIEVAAYNEVDACYEMIIRLHKLNLL